MIKWTKQEQDLTPAKSAKQWQLSETYIGYLVGTETVTTESGPGTIYVFNDADENGNKLTSISKFWKSVGLGFGLSKCKPGDLCKIVCTNNKFKQGKQAVQFDVMIGQVS